MGQKVRPTGYRIGIYEPWRSRWYAPKKEYGDLLVEDAQIRRFVLQRLKDGGVERIEIERNRDQVTVTIHASRTGLVIGRKGAQIEKLKEELQDLTGRRMDVNVQEVPNPNKSALLVAEDIAKQLEKRGSFRKTMKRALDQVMETGVDGVKIQLSGRLGGAEMSRVEKAIRGSIPLSTLRKRIDYGYAVARTPMGVIGVKVWIDLGEYTGEEMAYGVNAQAGQTPQRTKRSRKR
ncbi:MAG: 30S ribosomal protein S3 [Planctomycetaceae bacterium]|nr:MAG: 30S ribosomal protein S3 [Planctomycetaceae bacterium]